MLASTIAPEKGTATAGRPGGLNILCFENGAPAMSTSELSRHASGPPAENPRVEDSGNSGSGASCTVRSSEPSEDVEEVDMGEYDSGGVDHCGDGA